MLTKLSQWVTIWFCSLLHVFLSKSHDPRCSVEPKMCSLFDKSFRTIAYVITPHQVHLSQMTKHWDSFVSHCNFIVTSIRKDSLRNWLIWALISSLIRLVSGSVDPWSFYREIFLVRSLPGAWGMMHDGQLNSEQDQGVFLMKAGCVWTCCLDVNG